MLQQPQYRGKALPPHHPDAKLVQRIADRIIAAVEEAHGGGFQKHIQKFEWEVRWCGVRGAVWGCGCCPALCPAEPTTSASGFCL